MTAPTHGGEGGSRFVPYLDLDPAQRQEIHDWMRDHDVNPVVVPVTATFDRDDSTGEWRIPVFWADRNGRHMLDGEDPREHVVRRRELRPLPWPVSHA